MQNSCLIPNEIIFLRRMKNLHKHIAVIIISVVLVFTAGGIGFYEHYCLCTGNAFQSVFIPATCCDHDGPEHCDSGHLNHEISDCCPLTTIDNSAAKLKFCSHENCCDDKFLFLKTDLFDYSKSPRQTVKFVSAARALCIELVAPLTNGVSRSIIGCCSSHLPPPLLFGKELLSSIHQLKLDIPLS
jgi:hypothetical protein